MVAIRDGADGRSREQGEWIAETVEGARLPPRNDHLGAKIGHGRLQLGGGHRERRRGEGVRHRR